jgi:hypothetical protein
MSLKGTAQLISYEAAAKAAIDKHLEADKKNN